MSSVLSNDYAAVESKVKQIVKEKQTFDRLTISNITKDNLKMFEHVVVLTIIFIAEIVCIILLFATRSTIDEWLRGPLVDDLKKDYTGTNGTDAFSMSLNFVIHEFDCCGISDYNDFQNATKFNKLHADYEVPLICCRNINDTACAKNPTANNSYIAQGCYEAFEDWLSDHKGILIGFGAGVPAFQLILIIFAIVICCKAGKDNGYIPIPPYRYATTS